MKLNPDLNVRENKVWIHFLLDWLNKLRTWLKKLISDTTSLTESLREIKFNALNLRGWIKKILRENNFLKQKNADKNSREKPLRKNFWILTFWILFVSDFTNLMLNFKMLLTKNTVETESNWPITAKLPHHITSVLQKRGWISLALKVSSLLVAKNHFVFYFFVILKKRKWFLLGAVLIEILGVKAPPSQSRFPLAVILPKSR